MSSKLYSIKKYGVRFYEGPVDPPQTRATIYLYDGKEKLRNRVRFIESEVVPESSAPDKCVSYMPLNCFPMVLDVLRNEEPCWASTSIERDGSLEWFGTGLEEVGEGETK